MDEQFLKIQEICSVLEITKEQLLVLKNNMMEEIKRGLRNETHEAASIKCWPTHVQDFPNGCERGMFLVADLGMSYIRLSLFHLKGEQGYSVVKECYEVPPNLLKSESMEIFDYMTQCLQKFVKKNEVHREPLEMAVTFCFPLKHENLTNAALTPFTNNFGIINDDETDLGKIINNSIKHQKLRVQVVALLSDATGVLVACSGRHAGCKIGIVVGSGTNAAYVENIENIEQCNKDNGPPGMIVNTDWGSFGASSNLENIRNDFDRQVDKNSPNVGQRVFEKLVSGHYSAELARCLIVACANKGILFGGDIGKQLTVPFAFKTRHIVEMLGDDLTTFENTRLMFDKMGITRPSLEECSKVHYILQCVTRRSAALVAAGIACLLEKLEAGHVIIGIDGSFYRNNQVYHDFLEQCLQQLIGEERLHTTFKVAYTEDGSDRGAALLAAITLQKEFILQMS